MKVKSRKVSTIAYYEYTRSPKHFGYNLIFLLKSLYGTDFIEVLQI